MLLKNYLSRHYHLTVFVLFVSTWALTKHLMSGGDWVAVSTCAIGSFRAGDAVDTWIKGMHNGPDPGDHK